MTNLQIVCTLNLDRSQGRFQLSSRFISLAHIASIRSVFFNNFKFSGYLLQNIEQYKLH